MHALAASELFHLFASVADMSQQLRHFDDKHWVLHQLQNNNI